MARQSGIFPIEGTLGGVTFFKSGDGFQVRLKGGVSGNRIATDPAFVRTRENGAEFGRAGKAGKLLRTALRSLLQNASDRLLTSRLTKEMVKVVKADATNVRGMRNVIDGEIELLQGFEFNNDGKLSTSLYAPYGVTLTRATGQATVDVPAFVPGNMIAAPAGATHFKVVAAAAEVDFEGNTYVVDTKETAMLPLDNMPTAPISLESTVSPGSVHPLFVVAGIEFYQSVNGEFYSLNNGAFNALALVKVEAV
ncbi:hypothetical protein OCK74_22760 [Chitinophagaceae bacterium LB-8]|uniref:Uncharacterized protein n=1 Tax=Paraflavisolibacter caeni TaxID=2982496 RepID=A0A9X2XYN3_9BACT|nr:hypothetical protein [Paraflavisolibacter caeni]MCU7551959.1 hypothetical protein [Paraflavisolibacter caeni]